jgi:hypothetical protein
MKFSKLLESSIKTLGLKRIRLKCDPLNKEHESINPYKGYEGYVLEENNGVVSIYMVNTPNDLNPFIKAPVSAIEPCDKLTNLKKFIIDKINSEEINMQNASEILGNTSDITAIETYLKDAGMDDKYIKDLYREYILNEFR